MKWIHHVAAALSMVVGLAFMFGTAPFWWIGSGFIAGGIAVLLWSSRPDFVRLAEWLRTPRTVYRFEFRPSTLLLEVGCLLILAIVATVMMPEAAMGQRPVDHDHTVHYYKAWQLTHEFLGEGRLYGWSNAWFAGYPAQYLYPIGADLLVALVYVLTLGLAGFSSAYAWALWIFWILCGYVVYRFGANAFGRWAGLLAAVLFMTDTAGHRIGGWTYTMKWGVWPMTLGVVLGTWTMSRVPRLMEGVRWRDVGLFGLLMALALITHPYMMIYFAVTLTVAVVAFWLSQRERHWLIGTARLVVGAAVGTLVACIWLLPFMSSEAFMDPHFGGRWTSLYDMGAGFYRLNFLPGTWEFVTALGVVGTVALLWSRTFSHLLIGLLTITFIVFGSTDFLASMNWFDYFGSFQRVHFKRFIWLLKPFWILAAAYPIVAVVRYTAKQAISCFQDDEKVDEGEPTEGQAGFRRWFHVVLVVLCLTPLAVPFFNEFGSRHLIRDLTPASERPFKRDRNRVARWFEEKYPEGKPFFRVGLNLLRHDHSFVDLGAEFPFPLYKMGYTPATSYDFRMEGSSEELMKAVNVRYVISKTGPPSGDFDRVKTFGSLRLYEYRDWQKEPFEVIEGDGEVTLKDFSTEKLVFEAKEGAQGRLRINLSNFSRWHAYRDGEEIPIGQTKVNNHENTGFMTVELKPGTYRIVFERGWPERFGFVLFFLGLLLVAAFVLSDGETRVGELVRPRLERAETWLEEIVDGRRRELEYAGIAAILLGIISVAGMAWSQPAFKVRHHPELVEWVRDVHYDFGDQLRHGRVQLRRGSGSTKQCRPIIGQFRCGKASWKTVHQRVEDMGPEISLARCIWAHPQREGPLEISFSDVPPGEAIVGFFGIPESGSVSEKHPVHLKVGIDDVYRYEGKITKKKHIETFKVPVPPESGDAIDVRFQVSAPKVGKHHFCFNAQVADLADGVKLEAPTTEQ